MSWGSVSDFSVCQMEEHHFLKSLGVCGVKILVWGERTTGEQWIDPSQPHLKPVMQPKDPGDLADMVLKLLLKHLPAQPCVKKMQIRVSACSSYQFCISLVHQSRERKNIVNRNSLAHPWSGVVLSWPHPCCHLAMWEMVSICLQILFSGQQLSTFHPNYLLLFVLKCQNFCQCHLCLGR